MTDLAPRPSTAEYTPHALRRMAQRSVKDTEVEEVLGRPDLDVPHGGKRRATKGRLVVVYQLRPHNCPVVITTYRAAETDERSGPSAPAPTEDDPAARLLAFRDAKPRPAARRQPKRGSAPGCVLDWFKLRPGTACDSAAVAENVEFDIQVVRNACAKLCRDGLLQRVTRGRYRLGVIDESETDRRLAEINAELAATGDLLRRADLIQERIGLLHLDQPDVVDDIDDFYLPAPTGSLTPVEALTGGSVLFDYEEEIDSLLALIAPAGVHGHHEVAVARWREATRDLFDHLHE